MTGTDVVYGVSRDDSFAEADFILVDDESPRIRGVPFIIVGEGALPERYGTDKRFQRISGGMKVRYPIIVDGHFEIFVEGGGLVSYYQSEAIGTPYELEVTGGVGGRFLVGKGWSIQIAGRARHPTGNGNNHEEPEHAPHGTQAEFVLGLSKDF